ncbi:ABC transporter permease [Aquibacillus halophilus]|nr:ABC transporter permease [Aquibacillus halophilus]
MLEKKGQYGSALLLVIISSMIFYSFTTTGANLIDNLDQFFQENNVEDAQLTVSKPIQDIQSLEDKFDVKIEERYSKDVSLDDNTTIRLLDATESINQYALIEGARLEKKNELLISPSFAKEHNMSIGDSITLEGKSFTIVGKMAIPDYVYPLKSVSGFITQPENFGAAVVNESAFEDWSGAQLYYSIMLNKQNQLALKSYINQSNEIIQWTNKHDNNRITFIRGDIQGIKQAGETLPIGLLAITIVIVMIFLWRLLKKEYVQIGTLYAIGYKKAEIICHYVSYSIIIAALGSTVGTILGWFLMQPLLDMFSVFYSLPVLTIKPYFIYVLASLSLPIIFFVPLTYFLVKRVLRTPPVVLMKGGELKTKVNILERKFNSKRFSFSTRFKVREVLRSIPRVTFLTIGVMFATLLILIGFVTNDSFNYLVNDNYQKVNQYNYEYLFNQIRTTEPESGQIAASASFEIENKDNQTVVITGLKPDNTAIQLSDLAGNSLSFDSVIVNKALADKIDIKQGDSLTIHNQLNNKTFTIKIDHIANSFLGDTIYMPLERYNQLNGYPEESYTKIYSKQKLNIESNLLLATTNTDSVIKAYNQLVKPLKYMVGGIALGASVIAVIIIYILISLLIDENSFKISLMKVIGYPDNSIRKLIIDFNLWFVLLGFLVGIPVTLSSMSAFLASITAKMNFSIPIKVEWINIIVSLVIILIAYFVSILLNQRKLKKISMHEAINRSTE